jgi:hypothetical protein
VAEQKSHHFAAADLKVSPMIELIEGEDTDIWQSDRTLELGQYSAQTE